MENNYSNKVLKIIVKPQILIKYLISLFAVFSFTTGNSQCNYTVACSDTWGDGWNGTSSLSITVNGVEKGPVTGAQVTASSYTKTLTDVPYGATIVMTLSGSSGSPDYVSEISAVLKDPDGNSVAGSTVNDGNRTETITGCGTTSSWGCSGGPSGSWTSGDGVFLSCAANTATSGEVYTFTFASASGDVTATPPTGFEISKSDGSYQSSALTLSQSDVQSGEQVYVRMAALASSPSTDNLVFSSGGLSNVVNVSLSGTITSPLATVDAGSDVPYSLGGSIVFDATATISGSDASGPIVTNTEPFTSSPSSYASTSNTSSAGMWNGSSDDQSYWEPRSNRSGQSGSTGPDGGNVNGTPTSGNYYIYTEASGHNNMTFILESDVLTSPISSLSFYHHAYGSDMGVLKVDYSTNGGTSWTTKSTIVNGSQTHTSTSDNWTQTTINDFSSSTNRIRFHFLSGPGYRSDCGLDDIVLVTGNSTISWSGPNSFTSSEIDPTVSNSATAAMIGNYTLTVTDANGCPVSDIASVTSGPNIATNASFTTFASCLGSDGTAQSFTVSGSDLTNDISVAPPSGYEISTQSDFSSNVAIGASAQSLTLAQSGGTVNSTTIYVRLTSSASNGASGDIACSSSGATTVNEATGSGTVTTPPNAGTLSGTEAVCSNGSTTFSSNGDSGGAWSSATTGVATIDGASGAITPVAAGSSVITYEVTGTGGCSNASATRTVTVTAVPNAGTLSGTEAACLGGSAVTFTSDGDAGTWSSGTAGVATINSSTGAITPVSAGSSVMTYTVTGSGGCSDATATRTATVNTAPSVSAGSDVSANTGGSIALDATVSGNLTGSDLFTEAQSETANYGSGSFGGESLADPNWSGSTWKGQSTTTGSGDTGPSGPQSGDDYMYFEASNNSTGSLTSSTTNKSAISISFYYHMYGSSITNLKLETYDGSSWTQRWIVSGQQHGSSAASWTLATVDLTSYTVTQIRFTANSSSVSGDIALDNINVTYGNATYAWSTDASNGTTGWSATNTVDITVTASADGTHVGDYTLTVTDANGCQASDVAAVTVTTPTISTSGTLSTFTACSGVVSSEQSFSVSGTNMAANLVVTPPSGYEVSTSSGSGFGSSVSLSPSSGTVSSTTIYVRTTTGASNADGGNIACTSTGATTVNVATGSATINSAPNVTVSVSESSGNTNDDGVVCNGASVTLSGGGASSYSWDNSITNASAFTASSTTTYTVTGTDGNGCTNTAQQTITVNALPTTPSAGSDITADLGDAITMAATSNLSSTSITTEKITSTNNDAFQYTTSGTVYLDDTYYNLRLGDRGSGYGDCWVALRFTSVPVPQGASISSSELNIRSYYSSSYDALTGNLNLKIHAEDTDDAPSLSSSNSSISNKTRTTAAVDWDITSTWSTDTYYPSPDIKSVIQEIVNRAGWSSGNDITIILKDDGTSAGTTRNINEYSWSSTNANKLDISYTNGTMAWTTDASAGTGGFANTTEDPQITASADATHAGTYTLTVTDGNGCTASDAMTITTSTPTITTSGTLSTFSACASANSAEQSFSVSGSDLTNDIVVTPPSGYEVSTTSGSSFASSVTLAQSGGTVNSTTIYVRTTTAASNGDGGNIACTSTGATTVNVATGSATIVTAPNAGTVSGNSALNVGSAVTLTSSGDAGGTWSSDNTSAATINSSTGAVSAVATGNAVMTYTVSASPCSDATATKTVNVTNDFLSSGSSSNWSSTSAWGGGVVPLSSSDVTISHDMTVDVSTNTLTNLTVDNSKTLTVATGNTITVSGASDVNGTISVTGNYDANGAFDGTGGTITINSGGNVYMSSTVTSLGTLSNSGTLHFDGSSPQTIPGNSSKGTQPLGNFTVDGSNKTLSNSPAGTKYTMTGLTFGGGSPDLDLNSQELEFQNGATISGATNDKHIIDGANVTVKYNSSSTKAFKLPIGPDGALRGFEVKPSLNTATVYTLEYKSGTPVALSSSHPVFGVPVTHTNLTSINNHYYYNISPDVNTKTQITLAYEGLDDLPATSDRYMIHWDGSQWEELAVSMGDVFSTATPGDSIMVETNDFSFFGQGSGGGDALPIELVSFDASCGDNEVNLEFVVASQLNNNYYSIERSIDNKNWTVLKEIPGVEGGATSVEMTYKWTDTNPLRGQSYYQLSQTDFDGTSKTFAPISISCNNSLDNQYSAYPNPVKDQLLIDIELDVYQGDNVKLVLLDINGKIVKEEPVKFNRGFNHFELDTKDLPKGVYLLRFNGSVSHIKESRIIKK